MRVDLPGRIRNTALADRHGLQPLFEAVINAIDAIHDEGTGRGSIEIHIERDLTLLSPDTHGNTIPDVSGFTVVDNGIGFTSHQFASFETVDTTTKIAKGGKGVGRILWLRAFECAVIESVYCEDGGHWKRTFEFRPTQEGVERHRLDRLGECHRDTGNSTSVRLIGFQKRYQQATPKSVRAICTRIVEHCLKLFVLGAAPRIRLVDGALHEAMDLNALYHEVYKPEATNREFSVGGQDFAITDVFLAADADVPHQLHFCAHNRVVTTLALSGRIPHLPTTVKTPEGRSAVYNAYVSSPMLDERVDQERTQFTLDRKGDFSLGGGPTWEEVVDASLAAVNVRLEPATTESRRASVARVKTYVAERAPRYRPLLEHRARDIERLPGDLPDQKLDIELHKILNDWKTELRVRTQELDDPAEQETENGVFYRERFAKLVDELQEATVADLAEYVVHRRVILELLRRMLGRQEDGKFSKEEALHDVLFPRRSTSDEVDYDEHNLWILDERLAYHSYLASDIPLKKQKGPIMSTSGHRPDLVIFNKSLAFTEGGGPVSSVVIVEFKRPERDDYDDDSNPITQVTDYVRDLRDGVAKGEDGSTIELPPNVPFYCYIVATITPKLKREAEDRLGYTVAPDHAGYFGFNPNLKAYIEVLSYKKVLDDAQKRNRIFFEKLQMPVR